MIKIFGKPVDLPYDLTVNQAADFIRQQFPDLWKLIYTKHIEAPGNYFNFKAPAVTICSGIIEAMRETNSPGASRNIAIAAAIMQQFDFPTYYVGADLMKSIQHTHPPSGLTWKDIQFPFQGLIFMLPINLLQEPHTKASINFVGVAQDLKNVPLKIPWYNATYSQPDRDGIVIFYGVMSGLVIQSLGFPMTQALEASPGWILERTLYWDEQTPSDEESKRHRPTPEFLSYLSGLMANLLLVMTARPEMVEPQHKVARKILPKQNVISVPARFIGRKYEVKREGPRPTLGGHFTELIWRAGCYRLQHYGAKGQLTKVIWIDPYICYGRGLVKGEVS